jgi:mono/diheme cytochrome c family protein
MTVTMRILAGGLLAAATFGAAHAQGGGKSLFEQNCAACHQADGKGIPGAFPNLAGNAYVQGDPKAVAGTVLNGRGGMPTFRAELSRAQIAEILTYVRSAWGNTAGPVDTATVESAPGGGEAVKEPEPVLGFH